MGTHTGTTLWGRLPPIIDEGIQLKAGPYHGSSGMSLSECLQVVKMRRKVKSSLLCL